MTKTELSGQATYHHGDLRRATLELGRKRIEQSTRPDLGLRALARELEVSATALYRHFPSKDALLDALAADALGELGEAQAKAAAKNKGAKDSFLEVGVTYVEWAVKHPALLRLIYDRIGQVDLAASDATGMSESVQQLRAGIAAVMPESSSEEQRQFAALHAWSLVHGLSMLVLDGQVKYSRGLVEKVLQMSNF